MPLVLNEEQRLLRDTARDFLSSSAPVRALRKLRDEHDPLGYDNGLWRQMAQLGWASIILPEEYGGLDFGFTGLGVVLEECGRTLAASPLFATAAVGASALLLGGSEQQKTELLPRLASGELTLALALEEAEKEKEGASIFQRQQVEKLIQGDGLEERAKTIARKLALFRKFYQNKQP